MVNLIQLSFALKLEYLQYILKQKHKKQNERQVNKDCMRS